jgi:hypothetical protein
MKKIILSFAIIFACITGASAQVGFQLNLGQQPVWGPTGYDYVQYYYIPDLDAYYDVTNQVYVFNEGGQWMTYNTLPPRYNGFDLYGAYKVVINEPRPWINHDRYRREYYSYRGRHDQQLIRDSRDTRYWANPQHPYHNRWHGDEMRHEEHREWGGNRPHDMNRGHDDWNRGRNNGGWNNGGNWNNGRHEEHEHEHGDHGEHGHEHGEHGDRH